MSKYTDTRVVTFKEDYNPSGKRVLYKAGVPHFIHKDVVAALEKKGVKLTAKMFDHKAAEDKARAAFIKSKRMQLAA